MAKETLSLEFFFFLVQKRFAFSECVSNSKLNDMIVSLRSMAPSYIKCSFVFTSLCFVCKCSLGFDGFVASLTAASL